jgi:hypothetical protein
MKKFLFTIITTAFISLSSFANEAAEVNQKVISTFHKEFTQATNVEWQQSNGLNKATFSLNGKVLFAFYSNAGELIAVSRNLTSDQLPIVLNSELKKDFADFWISDLFEISSNGQTSYYVTLENANQKLVMESIGLQGWQTFKKEKKN